MGRDETLRITVADAPDIPGLTFRHLRDEADYPALAEIATAEWQAQGAEWAMTAVDLKVELAHLVNSDLVADSIVAEVKGRLVASGRTRWRDEEGGPLVHSLRMDVRPEFWGLGLRRSMLAWLEQRAGANAASHAPARAKMLETYCVQGSAIEPVLREMGYEIERYFAEMIRPSLDDIPDFPMPDGLEVRPVTSDQFRAIWDADVEAFRDHWSFAEPTEVHYEHFLADERTFQPELWQVAWDVEKNEVAGMVRTFIDHAENETFNRLRGFTEEISTRRPYRRRGLSRALIVRSLRAQRDAGMTESALGVDMDSPTGATRVYEDCGFRPAIVELLWRKPLVSPSP